ncbi:mitofusin [Entomophthora muscae]|uniref:Mitofusin n=1 Tax=Entomophthora muscae TaxID=34485 RepID=A0ACC2SD13_9FUNG|nr:mitofusin [Entomophthora muscae]
MSFSRQNSLTREGSYSTFIQNYNSRSGSPRFGTPPISSSSILSDSPLNTEPHRDTISFEQRERIFQDKSSRLITLLSETQGLVQRLGELNASEWVFRYPTQPAEQVSRNHRNFQTVHISDSTGPGFAPAPRLRSNSITLTESDLTNSKRVQSQNGRTADMGYSSADLDILRLEVKCGSQSNQRVIESLEKHSISNLLNGRLSHCRSYLDKLATRVSDKNSKILVTGDLNSGKSTFVNALLKRKVLPTDQQPCTMLFCEVLAIEQNDGFEEAHAIPCAARYNRLDPSTFERIEVRHLSKTVAEDFKGFEQVKIYCHDKHSTETMLNNGTLDITLIDSPGLNRDSLKTTQLFARQEEIDVVVFVVHAENQFTLSSQEFLQSAGKEKAYIFIVINRFDTIRDKKRCRAHILKQIKELSPRTYEDADELVHFVAAEECFPIEGDHALPSGEIPSDFQRLEGSLRSFILDKRARSKLAPAKQFAMNVLADISILAKFNLDAANKQHEEITSTLDLILPQYETTLKEKRLAEAESNKIFHSTLEYSRSEVEKSLGMFISSMGEIVSIPTWPGVFGAMNYVEALKQNIYCSLRQQTGDAERRVSDSCASAYHSILLLSGDASESVPPCPLVGIKLLEKDVLADIEITWAEMFDIHSKIRNLSIGFSALSFIGAQLVGPRQLAMLAFEGIVSSSPSGSSQLVMLAGFAFTGVGFLYLSMGDVRSCCTKKVIKKAHDALRVSRIAEKAGERSSANAGKYLQLATGHLYATYSAKIKNQEAVKQANLELQRIVGGAQAGFSALFRDSRAIASKLATISTDDVL